MAHNADGSVKMRTFLYSAYIQKRYHKDDPTIEPGQHREADKYLELHGVSEFSEIGDFLTAARLDGRKLYGVLISVPPEEP